MDTMGAEFHAAGTACSLLVWWRVFMSEVAPGSVVAPTPLLGDNNATHMIASDDASFKGSLYLVRRVRFVQWVVASGDAVSVKVSGLANPADFNTKHLPTTDFNLYEAYVTGHAK